MHTCVLCLITCVCVCVCVPAWALLAFLISDYHDAPIMARFYMPQGSIKVSAKISLIHPAQAQQNRQFNLPVCAALFSALGLTNELSKDYK